MITFVTGDLFQSPMHALVNTVNTEGVMGKGIALAFRNIYPEMFREYRALCEAGTLRIGTLFVYRTPNKIVVNFPTKETWRKPSRPEYIEAGLSTFVRSYAEAGIRSVAFPPLGCGNGELDFESQVAPLMIQYLSDLPIPVHVFPPRVRSAEPEHRNPSDLAQWLRQRPREMPIQEVWRDLLILSEEGHVFHTLERRKAFTIEPATGSNDLVAVTGDRGVPILREEFAELWRQLRAQGLLPAHAQISEGTAYLYAALAELPYVATVRLAGDLQRFQQEPKLGLQLVPLDSLGRPLELALTT